MFKVGDKVKFKKSSINTGMSDATESDVFEVSKVGSAHIQLRDVIYSLTGWWNVNHFEHAEESVMDNTDDAMNNSEEKEINWEIGQEVFCLIFGKGKVDYIGKDKDISVAFEKDAGIRWYTSDGKYFEDANRTLFFSEPKIEAEKFPPKKPFVPVFKKGDAVIVKWVDTTQVLILEEETERQVKGTCGQVWDKDPDVHFYKIGEEVKFS